MTPTAPLTTVPLHLHPSHLEVPLCPRHSCPSLRRPGPPRQMKETPTHPGYFSGLDRPLPKHLFISQWVDIYPTPHPLPAGSFRRHHPWGVGRETEPAAVSRYSTPHTWARRTTRAAWSTSGSSCPGGRAGLLVVQSDGFVGSYPGAAPGVFSLQRRPHIWVVGFILRVTRTRDCNKSGTMACIDSMRVSASERDPV